MRGGERRYMGRTDQSMTIIVLLVVVMVIHHIVIYVRPY
jgi:hypothetical protein